MKSKHVIWMLIGCTVPLLLIFLAPALGLGQNTGLFLFILAMFACHLFMPHGYNKHGHGQHVDSENSPDGKKDKHYESHSH